MHRSWTLIARAFGQSASVTKRFKIEPNRLLYALRWLNKGTPPDLDLTLGPAFARAPEIWFAHAAMLLLGALQQADPETPTIV